MDRFFLLLWCNILKQVVGAANGCYKKTIQKLEKRQVDKFQNLFLKARDNKIYFI